MHITAAFVFPACFVIVRCISTALSTASFVCLSRPDGRYAFIICRDPHRVLTVMDIASIAWSFSSLPFHGFSIRNFSTVSVFRSIATFPCRIRRYPWSRNHSCDACIICPSCMLTTSAFSLLAWMSMGVIALADLSQFHEMTVRSSTLSMGASFRVGSFFPSFSVFFLSFRSFLKIG